MRLVAALSTCALVALVATPAQAQVAVSVTIAEEDASQRDIAGKVVSAARKSWRMLSPQLSAAQTKACAAGDTECLRNVAAQAKATHLLVVGVAPLGVRDRVVAVQLFDVTKAAPRFEESVVQSGLNDGLTDLKDILARLVAVPGPPRYAAPPALEPPTPEPAGALGALSIGGFVLLGVGAATAAGSALTGWALVEGTSPEISRDVLLYGLATGGALAAIGSIAFAVDAL